MHDPATALADERRALFHDWLGHVFVPRISACRAQADDGSAAGQRAFVSAAVELAREWQRMAPRWLLYFEGWCDTMSPATLLGQPPLDSYSLEIRQWLASLVDESWRSRHDIDRLLRQAREAIATANACSSELLSLVDRPGLATAENRPKTICKVEGLGAATMNLRQAMLALPSTIVL